MGPFWVAACVMVCLVVAAAVGIGFCLAYRKPPPR
jgi:hypothetical protein